MDFPNSVLTQELGAFARQKGAELFGVADLAPAREFTTFQGNPIMDQFPRAISMGMSLNDFIVEGHSPTEPRRQSLYWHHVYDVVTPALDFLAYDVSRCLKDRGFKTFPIPGSTPYNFEKLEGIFSHKLAAHLAGLGWIGKNCMLLTDCFGPRVRFVTVLTDAPLLTGSTIDKPCGKCQVCVNACPVKAFTGREFQADEPRENRFEAFKCSEYRREHPCGICVSSCPMGSRSVRKGKGLLEGFISTNAYKSA
jgi:epoxyqueuosine reductase